MGFGNLGNGRWLETWAAEVEADVLTSRLGELAVGSRRVSAGCPSGWLQTLRSPRLDNP